MRLVRCVAFASLLTLAFVGVSARETREVIMLIGMPNGASPELRMLEGETGTVSLPNIGTFGFVPVVHDDDTVTVTVLDLRNEQRKQIAEVALSAGDVVMTDTTPRFSIRMVRVVRQADLTGPWTFEWNPDFSGQHTATHECQVTQQGEAMTIRCDGQTMNGKVGWKFVTFEHTTGLKNEITATYKATLDEKDTIMTGSWRLSSGEYKDGKFQAHRH